MSRIVKEPPFGSDGVPPRYETAWQALLSQCPPVRPVVWEAAIYDAAFLFGNFGSELARLGWTAGNLLDVPHDSTPGGLVWFVQGSPARRSWPSAGRSPSARTGGSIEGSARPQ
jgi:hypothetical protein